MGDPLALELDGESEIDNATFGVYESERWMLENHPERYWWCGFCGDVVDSDMEEERCSCDDECDT